MGTLVTLLLLVAAAGSPGTPVEYDPQVDFSRYETWSWHKSVTRAMNPVTDKRIREAIEKGLAARGLAFVDREATLLVAYHASRTTDIDVDSPSHPAPSPKDGSGYFQKGSLVIDMLDADSGKVVWRGRASDVLRYGPNEIAEEVKAAVDGLLASFPPPLLQR